MRESESPETRLQAEPTPVQVCGSAIGRLAEIWDEIFELQADGESDFIAKFFSKIWRDGDTGWNLEQELERWDDQPEKVKPFALLQAMLTTCAYACQGMKAHQSGDEPSAWRYTARTQYWLGLVVGTWALKKDPGNTASDLAKKGAAARHKENRDMKAQALEWFEQHRGEIESKDAAAAEIAGKILPVKFRTVRDWLKGH